MTVGGPDMQVCLLDPMAIQSGRKVKYQRGHTGGQVPVGCAYPPLEMASTAAVLRKRGVSVGIVEGNAHELTDQDIATVLGASKPEWVVLPSAWGALTTDRALLSLLRQYLPESKFVSCGPNVAAQPESILADNAADYVCLTEPEETIDLLVAGEAPEKIPNLAYRTEQKIQTTLRRMPPGWATYPLPARDLLSLERYTIPFSRRSPATTLHTTRGCPLPCNYCPTHIWNRFQVRPRDFELVTAEIDELVLRYRMRELIFRDDTFTADHERVAALCEYLLKRRHDLTWRVFVTTNTVTQQLLKLMARAGCKQICIGFETANDSLLEKTGKGTTVAQAKQAVVWARAAGMEVSGTFVVGLEGETRDTIDRTFQFMLENDLDYIQVNVATPLPGTGFGKRQAKAGRFADPDAFRWYGSASGEAASLSSAELEQAARRIYLKFYGRPSYVIKRMRSDRELSVLLSHAKLALRLFRHVAFKSHRV